MSNVPPAPWLMPPAARWMPLDQRNDNSSISSSILATALISLALVVAIVVFLHLYVRYVVRRQLPGGAGRRLTTIDLLRFHAATINIEETPHAASGLDPSAIAALPSFSYQKTTSGEEDEGNPAECAVCLSAVEEGEMVRLLPNCKHLFHVGCIDMWLASHMTCPVCRATVEPPPDTAADGGEASAPPQPQPPVLVRESSGATGTSQEGTSVAKEGDSVSSRLSASLKRMMSRERSSSSSRRAQGDATEDLERQ